MILADTEIASTQQQKMLKKKEKKLNKSAVKVIDVRHKLLKFMRFVSLEMANERVQAYSIHKSNSKLKILIN